MRIINQRDGCVVADKAELAGSLIARLVGLIGRRDFPKGSAMIIPGCRQVHTFLMRFPIDVLFIDERDKVVYIAANIKSCRITRFCISASRIIELPAGTITACGIMVGDILSIKGTWE